MKEPRRAHKVAKAARDISDKSALQRREIGFGSPHLLTCTLPHSQPAENPFVRKTPWCELRLLSDPKYGLPYGSIARLFMAYLQTEVVRTSEPEVRLAPTFTEAARKIGTGVNGQALRRLKKQLLACFATTWFADVREGRKHRLLKLSIATAVEFNYHPERPDQVEIWEPWFRVSKDFYDALMERRVPYDLRALKALSRSPLGMDLYTWLSVKAPKLSKREFFPYTWFMEQWGTGFDPANKKARTRFQQNFTRELKAVEVIWPEIRVRPVVQTDPLTSKMRGGVDIYPARPHVPTRNR